MQHERNQGYMYMYVHVHNFDLNVCSVFCNQPTNKQTTDKLNFIYIRCVLKLTSSLYSSPIPQSGNRIDESENAIITIQYYSSFEVGHD